MSRFDAEGTIPSIGGTSPQDRSWQKPAAADDIVDPIQRDDGFGARETVGGMDREQSDEEAEDVPLDVKLTDSLSMLADGGHDYGATPLAAEDIDDDEAPIEPAFEGERPDLDGIDESSKDA